MQTDTAPTSEPQAPPLRVKKPYHLPIIALVVVLSIAAVNIWIKVSSLGSQIASPTPTPTISPSPSTSPTPSASTPIQYEGWKTFTHPRYAYKLRYPGNFEGMLLIEEGDSFAARTIDYQVGGTSFIKLVAGVEFEVMASPTDRDTPQEIIDDDLLLSQIAKNQTQTTVDSQPALRYNFSYEGIVATDTILVYNGLRYTIRYRYISPILRYEHWDEYLLLIDSFQLP